MCYFEWFSENVNEILIFRNMRNVNELLEDEVTYVMSEDIDVFGFEEVDEVLSHLNGDLIINENTEGLVEGMIDFNKELKKPKSLLSTDKESKIFDLSSRCSNRALLARVSDNRATLK